MYIYINGRVEYALQPGQGFPLKIGAAKILSIAVSSLETEGISCVNIGINPLIVEGQTTTEYVIDTRKAVCVKQVNTT